ncbi:MAG: T9SS type A sorting domain-containing protein [FCB group bacterium]|jgi:hypothetical protein
MKKIILFILLIVLSNQIYAQAPVIEWQKCLGGDTVDVANSIIQTSDGGYIVTGHTDSNDGDVSGHHIYYNVLSKEDIWVVKLNSSGIIQWQKCLGGSGSDYACSIQQTSDGGYIVAGFTDSNDGDVSGNHGGDNDSWVVKLDISGAIQWQKCLGGSGNDWARTILQTRDGGYIVAGATTSNDGDVSGNHDSNNVYWDFWVVKLDAIGKIQWQKCLGGSGYDEAWSIQQTSDGGYIVAGYTESNDGDVSGNHGNDDIWVVKLDTSGTIHWQKCLGGSGYDVANSIQQTSDGGYIIAGETESKDGDVSGIHGDGDVWVIKLDINGTIQWQKCYGGFSDDEPYSIQQTNDGGYIVAGCTESNDGDISGNHGTYDFWVVKLDVNGIIQWQKCLGGSGDDEAYSIQQTSDGGYIVAGSTGSNDGDVSGNHGGSDFWIVKLSPETAVNESQSDNFELSQIRPNPTDNSVRVDFNLPLSTNLSFNLYDISGNLISKLKEQFYNSGQITENLNLGNIPTGTYLLKLESLRFNKTFKIIINK